MVLGVVRPSDRIMMRRFSYVSIGVLGFTLSASLYAQLSFSPTPARVVGQATAQLVSGSPNLVEGRELFGPQGVALDTTVSPPILYVADTFNNRVLAYRNSSTAGAGAMADLFIGQTDRYSTVAGGPGTQSSTGLRTPTSVAVDGSGNLYVADGGNNRVLRFPRPFSQGDTRILPDMVIGQTNFNSSQPNQNLPSPGASTLASSVQGQTLRTTLSFDRTGNLWVADPFNNRVLRFPAAVLQAGANGPNADLVLGQPNFTRRDPPTNPTAATRSDKTVLLQPSGIGIDGAGRVYVSDDLIRVMVYVPNPNLQSGQAAARIMGVTVPRQGELAAISEYTLGFIDVRGNLQLGTTPGGIFFVNNQPYVLDTGANRILRYDPFEQWPAENANQLGPPARAVFGQSAGDFASSRANRGAADASGSGFVAPTAASVGGNEVLVADSNNNRVLAFPIDQTGMAGSATRVVGQLGFQFTAANLIEGREFFVYNGGAFSDGAGVVVDSVSSPPHLFVADTFNNRILGFRDARNVRLGAKADIVIGQPDLNRSLVNFPFNDAATPGDRGLFQPAGLAVDANGDLWVADGGNSRVLRFPRPFERTEQRANLVIGQPSFGLKVTDPSNRTMSRPYGVAFTTEGNLLVSDADLNRVLYFRKPTGQDFSNGQIADRVIGQPDFVSRGSGNGPNQLAGPRGIATDADDRLYVCDTANGRIQIYDRITTAGQNPTPARTLSDLSNPHGITVSKTTGEIWVTNTIRNELRRYPRFERLVQTSDPDYGIAISTPIAITLDSFGNLIAIEGTNRLSFYFPGMAAANSASYSRRNLSPGVIASIFPTGGNFGDQTVGASSLPLPKTLGDIQVLVNDQPAPLYFVSPGQINFLMPMSTPTSGNADFLVVRPSTGQVFASGQFTMSPYTPALFTVNQGGSGQIAALNQDNSVNNAGNPIPRGQVIQLFGTGQGFVNGAPPDGEAASGAVPVSPPPQVIIGTSIVPIENVEYSGLAPGFPGLWQINVRIPDGNGAPIGTVPVVLILGSIPSNEGPAGRITTTIVVK